MIPITPLDRWISTKIGADGCPLDLQRLRDFQLRKLNETLALAQSRSRFYRTTLGDEPLALTSLDEVANLPFTAAADIKGAPFDFLCVKQDDVDRIVTLPTSGTTGSPKRVFFTAEDQELTRDFFHWGMSTLVEAGERVLILLPGSLPGGVGALLEEGLARMGVTGIQHGPVDDPRATLEVMRRERATSLVGIPVQVLALAKTSLQPGFRHERLGIHSVLLSTDYVPESVVRAIESAWDCRVFNHYGTTEMGLGGGVDCRARAGYHLREADMLFEVVDPDTGRPQPAGTEGEVVFTTLTRRAMPLIRYRTGDAGRFLTGPCPCGTGLRRLAHIERRMDGNIVLSDGRLLAQKDFDEALLGLEGVADFRVEARQDEAQLSIEVLVKPLAGSTGPRRDDILAALRALPLVRPGSTGVHIEVAVTETDPGATVNSGTGKRKIRLTEESDE